MPITMSPILMTCFFLCFGMRRNTNSNFIEREERIWSVFFSFSILFTWNFVFLEINESADENDSEEDSDVSDCDMDTAPRKSMVEMGKGSKFSLSYLNYCIAEMRLYICTWCSFKSFLTAIECKKL